MATVRNEYDPARGRGGRLAEVTGSRRQAL